MTVAAVHEADQIAHLAQRDQQPRSCHESEHDGFGDVTRQVSQLQDRNDDLDRARHQGEEERRFVDVHSRVGIKGRQRAEDDE